MVAIIVAVVLTRDTNTASAPTTRDAAASADPLVDEFRAVERSVLAAYNAALREQRENRMDELELSNVIERDVLTPWRALRARMTAATVPLGKDTLYATLRRYLEKRQISWEAYVTALRAPSDDAARPHYEAHRQNNAEAQDIARELGAMFRSM